MIIGTQALAGATTAGDGGHAVLCSHGPETLLDLYEATEIYGRQPPLLTEERDVESYIRESRDRVSNIMGANHPSLVIFDQADYLRIEMELIEGPIEPTGDVGIFAPIPRDCAITQIAKRWTGILDSFLVVDKHYWIGASSKERAMFLIHEGAHSWFDSHSNMSLNGSSLRQFTGLLFTAEITASANAAIKSLLENGQPLLESQLSTSALSR